MQMMFLGFFVWGVALKSGHGSSGEGFSIAMTSIFCSNSEPLYGRQVQMACGADFMALRVLKQQWDPVLILPALE